MNNMSKLEVSGSNPASKDIKAEAEHGQTVVVLYRGLREVVEASVLQANEVADRE